MGAGPPKSTDIDLTTPLKTTTAPVKAMRLSVNCQTNGTITTPTDSAANFSLHVLPPIPDKVAHARQAA